MAYAVAADAASLVGLGANDVTSAHTSLADRLVDSLMNRINDSGDGFSVQSVTDEVYDIPIDGTRKLLLRKHPMTTLTSVKVDYQTNNPTTLDSSNYLQEDGILRLVTPPVNTASISWVSSFPRGVGSVAVSYSWGYSSVPSLIVQLANIIAGKLAKEADIETNRPASGVSSVRIGDFEEKYGDVRPAVLKSMDNAEKQILMMCESRYKQYEF